LNYLKNINNKICIKITEFYNNFIETDKYLTYTDTVNIKLKYKKTFIKVKSNLFLFLKNLKFIFYYSNISLLKKKQNKLFINKELIEAENLLDNINGYPLDLNQRKAVVTDEDNILVIAGAGSGKTLTIIGKIRYLIERRNIKESEILCISFTNDSVNDIKKAISKNYNYNIDVFTFHKLALNILRQKDKSISIAKDDLLDFVINEYFEINFSNSILLKKENNKFYYQFKLLIKTFINLFKSNNYNINDFDMIFEKNIKIKNKKERKSNYLILLLIKEIYIEYQNELKSQNKIDFNDMINYAATIVNKLKYKYIIIDEYQDTSYTRYNLIKQIKDKNNVKIMCVGDDFQSIYRFTGCNLDIFLEFEKYFGKSEILKIENTYRNSKELIDIAGSFVMKNKKQMKKKLKSNKKNLKPVKIVYYNNLVKSFEKLINKIDTNIFVLGRNNRDINDLINSKLFTLENNYLIYKKDKSKVIRFLTVHRSKGLEQENVIVLNNLDDYLGFPSKIVNDKILDFVLLNKDSYKYEEERRLFYVALTRTKENVYLFTKKNKESIFIKEILKYSKNNIQTINDLV
jgi:DNA helicase-4